MKNDTDVTLDETPDFAPDIQPILLRQLFDQGVNTQYGATLGAFLYAGATYFISRSNWCLAWLGLTVLCQLWRRYFFYLNARLYPAPEFAAQQPDGAWRYLLPLFFAASMWGLAPWFILPWQTSDSRLEVISLILSFAMMTGAVPALAPRASSALVWFIPLAALSAARYAADNTPAGWFICFALVGYGFTMIRYTRSQHESLAQGLRDQLHKKMLSDKVLLQARELERLNQERNRFFAAASHDLRQPVYALELWSNVLQRDNRDGALQPTIEHVAGAVQSVTELLNAMLSIAKIDAGAVHAVPRPINLHEVFVQLGNTFSERYARKELDLRFRGAAIHTQTDPTLLLRILSNLLENALAHTTQGGVLVSARRLAQSIRISVWDTGAGIGPEHQARVFEEFYQAGNPQRDKRQGLGLGLAIVKRLAALLQATVSLKSTLGRGSVFRVDLPLQASLGPDSLHKPAASVDKAPTASEDAKPAARILPQHILIIDDEPMICEALREWLAPMCQRVDISTQVDPALRLVQDNPHAVQALIVDFRVDDERDGLKIIALLRAAANRAIPALLVTGDTAPDRMQSAIASGIPVLFKPVKGQDLVDALAALRPKPT